MFFLSFGAYLCCCIFSCTPSWPCVPNKIPPPVFFYAPSCPFFAAFCSMTPLSPFLNHVGTHTPPSHTHMWSCLCWCFFVFLCGCWPHWVCPRGRVCVCWCVCVVFLCLLRCLWLNHVLGYVFACVVRVCVCVCLCVYFGQITSISLICIGHAWLN